MSVTRRGLKLPSHLADLMKPGSVRAGVLAGETYPEALLTNAKTGQKIADPRAGMPVAVIAAALEFGEGQNHARPFMATTFAREGNAWSAALVALLKQGKSADAALFEVGQVMKEDIKYTIFDWPADNSESWAAFKGFNKGLTLTGRLNSSIEAEVTMAGGQ